MIKTTQLTFCGACMDLCVCAYYRLAWTYDCSHDGRSDVIADLHLQQQLNTLHHGHLEETSPTGLRKRAATGRQVCEPQIRSQSRVPAMRVDSKCLDQ